MPTFHDNIMVISYIDILLAEILSLLLSGQKTVVQDGCAGYPVRDHHDDGNHPQQGRAPPLHCQVASLLQVGSRMLKFV